MEIISRKLIFFSFVQIVIATDRYRHSNRQDPGRNFKIAIITLEQYNILLNFFRPYETIIKLFELFDKNLVMRKNTRLGGLPRSLQ